MVRIYNQPATLNPRQGPPLQPQPLILGANGFTSPATSPTGSLASQKGFSSSASKDWGELRTVDVFRVSGKGLGISIVSGRVDGESPISGIFVKNVLPDSPAGKTENIFVGDMIVEVGGVQLVGASQELAVEAIKNAGNPVRFVVQGLKNFEPKTIDNQQSSTKSSVIPKTQTSFEQPTPIIKIEKSELTQLVKEKNPENTFQDSKSNPSQFEWTVKKSHEDDGDDESESLQTHVMNTGLSPSKKCYSGTSSRNSGENTPLENPEIIQLGLTDIERQALQQKIQAEIQNKREEHLNVYKRPNSEESENYPSEARSHVVTLDDTLTKRPKIKTKSSMSITDKSDSEEENQEENDERINSTENFKALKGEVIEVEVTRNKYGFGLAIAGHKDRSRMGAFICGIHPEGPAALDGRLKSGDELLKVHHIVVRGRSHLNVSAMIKKITQDSSIRIVVLRSKKNTEKIAVQNFCQFPNLLDEVIFSSPEFDIFKAKRELKVHKTTEGIGIMIIEGSHKVLGKGIFVSDIQQGSLAQRADLRVGDMILAVNTESFLNISHDEASLILKQVTGYMRLLVVNPADEIAKRNGTEDSLKAETSLSPNPAAIEGPGSRGRSPQISPAKSPGRSTLSPGMVDGSKSPIKSPGKSPALTPSKSPMKSPMKTDANKIELKKDPNGLGISIVGGADTPINGIVVHEIFKNGSAGKDGKLQQGDKILSVNGTSMDGVTHQEALRILRTSKDKTIIVIEPKQSESPDIYQDFEVELNKKPGKGLGLNIVGKNDGKGVYITELVAGGSAELNGKLLKGDEIISVNGKDISEASQDQAVAALKTFSGNVQLKIRRFKIEGS